MSEEKNESTKDTKNKDKSSDSKKPSRRRSVGIVLLGVLLAAILIPLGVFVVAYATYDVPEPEEVTSKQVSSIYASDAETELARIVPPEGNRRQVELEEVPEHVQNAVLAAEDREFWTNIGFSVTGFGRAVVGQLTGDGSAGGGSTITQQYVKNSLVGDDYSYVRKARELVYSVKMTNEWSKEDILAAYLNTVYLGRNAYGIEAASHAYFDKPVSELTVEEGALLAAIIQLPSQLDPWNDPVGAETRWNYVLDGMVEMGELSAEEREGMVFPETRDPAEYSAYTEATGTNGMIKNNVIAELGEVGITEEDMTTRGLQITTTIDTKTQEATLDSVEAELAGLQEDARAAVVSIEPGTGAVRSYFGGDDATGWDYANAGLQTGSTFKIFGLAAALQQGIPLSAMYDSSPVSLPGDIVVNNWDNSDSGYTTIAEALKRSYNTSFIRLQDDLYNTTQDTADMAHALGVARSLPGVPATLTENGGQPYEGIILGQYQSRAIDMSTALATVANGGVWHETHFVERVETSDGEVLYEHEVGEGERRVSELVAANLLSAMEPIAGYSSSALAEGRTSAAKTGTAQLGDTGQNKDAWMIGATPQLSTAVWVGTADNTSAIFNEWGGNMFGSNAPSAIWKSTLDGALEGQEVLEFDSPGQINFGSAPNQLYYDPVPAYTPPAYTTPAEAEPTEEEASEPEPVEEEPAPAPEVVVPEVPTPDEPEGGGIEIAPGLVIPDFLTG
ncbi:transglycosylase domain-containing protein [Corynebacterium alimapuense]|uniref:Penicillin-binding protein n=1 Tax=Corynebacterium alimapuense TaxID=1576874 RepID=A0A3M8K5Q6_9CORY|nr:transglycosylase domain-containing protein [Corynebacterium alimapuense]RNE48075.1 penicillin-binding protein [Corynebacterium alimapuense]